MSALELLIKIRPNLISRITLSTTRGTGVRENFQSQLSRYFDLLEQAVTSGDPSWLDTILQEWASSKTESDLESGETNITSLINQIIVITNDVAREMLSSEDALELLATVIPYYIYGLEVSSRYEMETRIAYISSELVGVQQKLEKLDRSKSSFIAVAAHELKTPLTLIEGYTSMMRDSVPKSEQERLSQLLEGVNIGIRRLKEIVDDMIDVSLIDNNLLSLNFQPVWLNRTFKLLEHDLNKLIAERHLEFSPRPFPGSEIMIFADPERIYQAFRNILLNAIKYTPDGGRIAIDGRILPGFIEITIADTGIGISPENQSLIFEKFGQLGEPTYHSSGKTKFKGGGPGLGLPISLGIIEAHGGTIWVESEGYDEVRCPGSIFHVLIPVKTEPSDARLAKLFGFSEKLDTPDGKT